MVYRAVGEGRGQHGAQGLRGQCWQGQKQLAGSRIGNFLHIHETIGTIRYICCHTCAKTQHKPLSQKKMRAQIAPIRKSPPLKLHTARRHGGWRAVMLKVVVHWPDAGRSLLDAQHAQE
jgi:hypothetical protein